MQWIRIERYWDGEYPNAKLSFIPMLCQHCDAAPCETVCPVSATYHNPLLRRLLSVRSPVFQLLRSSLANTARAATQPRRHGQGEGGHGEMHVLCAAYPASQRPCQR
jgi:hypothetical protein